VKLAGDEGKVDSIGDCVVVVVVMLRNMFLALLRGRGRG